MRSRPVAPSVVVGHGPGCGAELTFGPEFWAGDDRHVLCWCAGCDLMCTVVVSPQPVATEPEH